MNYSRMLMSVSALFLGALGVVCQFAPEIVLQQVGASPSAEAGLVIQIAGTLYLGLAVLNWMSRGSTIGGIYARPLIMGNLLHFLATALVLIKAAWHMPDLMLARPLAVGYVILCIGFVRLLFGQR